jgi:hypothetical protein
LTLLLEDSRPRLRRMKWPLIGVGALVGATAMLAQRDPNVAGSYPLCPTRALLGLDCPGCGGLRCVNALAHGDLYAAMDHNLLAVILIPFAMLWIVNLLITRWRGATKEVTPHTIKTQRIIFATVTVLAIAFTVARNLPFVPFLDSAVS